MTTNVTALPPKPLRSTRVTNKVIPEVANIDGCSSRLLVVVVVVVVLVDDNGDAPGDGLTEDVDEAEQSVSRVAIGSTIAFRCTISQSDEYMRQPSIIGVNIFPLYNSRKAKLVV